LGRVGLVGNVDDCQGTLEPAHHVNIVAGHIQTMSSVHVTGGKCVEAADLRDGGRVADIHDGERIGIEADDVGVVAHNFHSFWCSHVCAVHKACRHRRVGGIRDVHDQQPVGTSRDHICIGSRNSHISSTDNVGSISEDTGDRGWHVACLRDSDHRYC